MKPKPIAHPEWIDGARDDLSKGLELDRQGILPKSIRGVMVAVPCIRLLRCVYGNSNILVGWIILRNGVEEWLRIWWFRLRARCGVMWLNKEEREAWDSVRDMEDEP